MTELKLKLNLIFSRLTLSWAILAVYFFENHNFNEFFVDINIINAFSAFMSMGIVSVLPRYLKSHNKNALLYIAIMMALHFILICSYFYILGYASKASHFLYVCCISTSIGILQLLISLKAMHHEKIFFDLLLIRVVGTLLCILMYLQNILPIYSVIIINLIVLNFTARKKEEKQ